MATHAERLAELNASASVLEAVTQSQPAPIGAFETLYESTIRYASVSGDVAKDNLVKLVGIDHGEAGESWYWLTLPDVLRAETKYLTGRTANGWAALSQDAQKSAIESFCNDVYEDAVAGAQDIREFSVSPVRSDTVKVSGYFDLGTTWERQDWYIRLIDPNGSVAAPYSNIEFQRVYDEAPQA